MAKCIFESNCDGCPWYDGKECNLQEVKDHQKELTLKDTLGDPAELGGNYG